MVQALVNGSNRSPLLSIVRDHSSLKKENVLRVSSFYIFSIKHAAVAFREVSLLCYMLLTLRYVSKYPSRSPPGEKETFSNARVPRVSGKAFKAVFSYDVKGENLIDG